MEPAPTYGLGPRRLEEKGFAVTGILDGCDLSKGTCIVAAKRPPCSVTSACARGRVRGRAEKSVSLRLLRLSAPTQPPQARPPRSILAKFPHDPKDQTCQRQNRNLPEHQKEEPRPCGLMH